jgi:hypothetical protein
MAFETAEGTTLSCFSGLDDGALLGSRQKILHCLDRHAHLARPFNRIISSIFMMLSVGKFCFSSCLGCGRTWTTKTEEIASKRGVAVGEQNDMDTQPVVSGFAGQWHHRPQVPIKVSPFFSWPPDPRRMVTWVADRWFAVAENSILVLISLGCWMWLQPSMEEAKTLSIGWIAEIYIRNLILLFGVAGGLHLYFFVWKRQRMELKFDKRDLAKGEPCLHLQEPGL